jgi:peptidoglycan/xylan/chitin deacetylase (PgdA/CDA1 family)
MGMSGPAKVEEIWREDFAGIYEEGGDGCYVLTMHPQIIGRHHRMQMLERILAHILEHDGVWFAQMREIAQDFRGRAASKAA